MCFMDIDVELVENKLLTCNLIISPLVVGVHVLGNKFKHKLQTVSVQNCKVKLTIHLGSWIISQPMLGKSDSLDNDF